MSTFFVYFDINLGLLRLLDGPLHIISFASLQESLYFLGIFLTFTSFIFFGVNLVDCAQFTCFYDEFLNQLIKFNRYVFQQTLRLRTKHIFMYLKLKVSRFPSFKRVDIRPERWLLIEKLLSLLVQCNLGDLIRCQPFKQLL